MLKSKESAKRASRVDKRIVALLDQIAGDGMGAAALAWLLDKGEPPRHVADALSRSTEFERLYKRARTGDIGVEGAKQAQPSLVDMSALPLDLDFDEQYRRFFRPRLAKRADGFDVLFQSLLSLERSPLIIETGCLRQPGNWEGDGQSTFMFDALVRSRGGALFSIDVTNESIDSARRVCSSAAQLIENDSVAALDALSRIVSRPIDLLYLDSFDLDPKNPLPSAIHHALELAAARPLIAPGTLICVDDYGVGAEGGKGMIVDRFMSDVRAKVLYSGYQKVWRMI